MGRFASKSVIFGANLSISAVELDTPGAQLRRKETQTPGESVKLKMRLGLKCGTGWKLILKNQRKFIKNN